MRHFGLEGARRATAVMAKVCQLYSITPAFDAILLLILTDYRYSPGVGHMHPSSEQRQDRGKLPQRELKSGLSSNYLKALDKNDLQCSNMSRLGWRTSLVPRMAYLSNTTPPSGRPLQVQPSEASTPHTPKCWIE